MSNKALESMAVFMVAEGVVIVFFIGIVSWFVKRLIASFENAIANLCSKLDKFVDKVNELTEAHALLRGEHDAIHGKKGL